MLLVLGGNPVYTAPADFQFTQQLQKAWPLPGSFRTVPRRKRPRQCHWHLPETHYLEAWSDTRTYDGTASIVQPLIEPLYSWPIGP